MSYYPPFTKCQDLGLELQNNEGGSVPLIFADRQRTRAIEIWPNKKVRLWAERQVVYAGHPDSEYDFNTLWDELVTAVLPPI